MLAPEEAKEGIRYPAAGDVGGREPLDMAAGS